MATSAAVISLMQDLERHLTSYDHIFGWSERDSPFTKKEIENLYNTVSLMDSFLRDSSGQSYNHQFLDRALEKRVLDVVHTSGNYIDYWAMVYDLKFALIRNIAGAPSLFGITEGMSSLKEGLKEELKEGLKEIHGGRVLSLTQITEEMVSINEELKKIRDHRMVQDSEIASSTGKSSTFLIPSRRTPKKEGKLVGIEKDLVTMLHNLTGDSSKLKVFSIIGMAGIGKTSFSRKLYDDPLAVHHFHVRAWVTVSQQYQVKEMLLGVLSCVTNVYSDEIYRRSNEELREQVYKNLYGKRYFIVLDDMWDTKGWDELQTIFPDDKNGSRILLTTRLRDVAVHASKDTAPHSLRCLNIHESWELLSSKVFVDESCPLELVEIGKEIAYKCQGLPLAIVVIGGLLSKMEKKLDIWEEVAQSVGSLLMEKAEDCKNILALSYKRLPDHLKACFLYMGIFPEDYEISVKKLIWLWVAEGFIRPSSIMSLEEVAEGYLEDLTTRSLILVKRRGCDGNSKTCYIHDLMRELCLSLSQEQNFLHVVNSRGKLPQISSNDLHNLRRLSFHSTTHKYINGTSFPCTHSVICFERLSFSDPQSYFGMHFKLLKVLDIMNIHLNSIPEHIKYLTLLKFLALTVKDSGDIMFLFKFRSLQTLVLDREWDVYLPTIFWYMQELRHFHLKRNCLSLSPDANLSLRVLNNLRSISTVRPITCTEKILLSMPHLKKLGIYETEEDHQFRGWFRKLVHLQELETLKYVFSNPFVNPAFKPDPLPPWDTFPPKLVKVTLSGTSLPWDDMIKLSMLPKLEVLKLRNYAFSGTVWKSKEGGFHCLRFLLIGSTNLEIWEADGTHFPNLQRLVLRHCRFLKEIPYGIGEAPLLENIELHRCKDSAARSARDLQEERQRHGDDYLTVLITEG